MTRVLLIIRDNLTRDLLAQELRDLFSQIEPACQIDHCGSVREGFDHYLEPARLSGRDYHTIVVDAHLSDDN
jgi:hypothetical protein